MKIISKFIQVASSIGLTVGLVAMSAPPTFAVPANTTETSSASCTKITALGTKTNATISSHVATMRADFAKRLADIASRDTTTDQKVAAARTMGTEKFANKSTDLESRAGLTAVQQAAIKTYVTNMQMAEKTRETAIDAARATYRTGLLTAVQAHQTKLTAATTAYQAAVATAFTTASAQCSDSGATATLKTAVKAARETFKTARTDAKVSTDIKALNMSREEAIKAANADFKKAATTYRATLSAVLETTTPKTNR